MQNALTIDVEDYYQVSNFSDGIHRHDWPNYPDRVVRNTHRILQLLERYQIKATFYVLGYVAEKHPSLVREINAAGHEIGSHSYWHRLVYDLSPGEFRNDLRRSRDVLQDITGKAITGFRSPSFSITHKSLWALEILVEEGFTVDSSIFPVHHGRYGIPDAYPHPFACELAAGRLWEFPVSVCRFCNQFNVPISGGGYFRLFPFNFSRRLLKRINDQLVRPFVFYIHPWELDPDQPRLKAGSRQQRFRHYVNLASNEEKFERLLQCFDFGPLNDVLKNYIDTTECPQVTRAAIAS